MKKISLRKPTVVMGGLALVAWLLSWTLPAPPLSAQQVIALNAPHELTVVLTGGVSLQALAVEALISRPGVGSSTSASPAYLGPIMGNFRSSQNLSATRNILFGVLGKYDHTGTSSSSYPGGPVIAEIGDNTTAATSAFQAVMGGDSEGTESAIAAFGVDWQSSALASRFNFGLDLQGGGAHDGFSVPRYNIAALRMGGRTLQADNATVATVSDVCVAIISNAPVNGTSGTRANSCGPGSLLIRGGASPTLYMNTNTLASPTWTVVGTQS